MTKIVFIEGVSGVGKTTTAQKICDRLRGRGLSAHSYLEFDFDNPVDFYCTAYFKKDNYDDLLKQYNQHSESIKFNTIFADDVRLVRYYNRETPISEYTRVFKVAWEKFTKKTEQYDFVIFDGSLLHHPINDMMRNYDASCYQVSHHVNALLKVVEPFNPSVIYLSIESVTEQLRKARISRNQTPASAEQIQFWEERKQMDLAVIRRLPIPCDVFDITQGNWETEIDVMVNRILETGEERRARIYPIILSEYSPAWPEWYAEEKVNLIRLIGAENFARINHIGSTAVPGLMAKPTVDILLEVNEAVDIGKLISALSSPEYICLSEAVLTMPTPPPHLMFLKGYLPNGFAEKVYHIHVRYPGDWDELHFKDYLIAHPETTAEYADLKNKLFQDLEHNRDGYTGAKSQFVKSVMRKARASEEG